MLIESAERESEVTFLGIDHMDRFEDGEAFVDEFGIEFATIHDIDGDVAFNVGGRAMPTTVVFDRDGRLAGRVFGELTPTSLEQLLARKPEKVIQTAVKGMMPRGPLGRAMLRKLKVYAGAEHPHTAQQPQALEL